MKRIIKRNKDKITRAFRDDTVARKSLSLSNGRRHYYHYMHTGEYVWVY